VVDVLPFVKAVTLLAWAGATWWIPLLVLVGWWRHRVRRVPLVYTPEYWGLVFPLGMYTVGSLRLVDATGLRLLQAIPHVTIYAALFAWSLTFFGLVRRLAYARWSR
jgi:tellurite resistance protein TehA-like permease